MLTMSSVVAATASVALAALTACAVICVTRVLMIGGIGVRDEVTAIGPVCFLLLASAASATSSVRGLAPSEPDQTGSPSGRTGPAGPTRPWWLLRRSAPIPRTGVRGDPAATIMGSGYGTSLAVG